MRVFEVGDRVLVRENFWKDTPLRYLHTVGVNPDMKPHSGQKATIVHHWVSRDLGERMYHIDIDNKSFSWVSDWLYRIELKVEEGDDL